MSNADKLSSLGIELRNRNSGQIKTICPKCSESRKKKNDPCLSVNIDTGKFTCHNNDCEWNSGGGVEEREVVQKVYIQPIKNTTKLSDKTLVWFSGRKISNATVMAWDITESQAYFPQTQDTRTAINFNYYRDGQLVNTKFRSADKSFKLSRGAELIFYGLDKIKDNNFCVIVEGEMDALAYYEANVLSVCSVPNGASKSSMKMEYLDNCIDHFKDFDVIFIATDMDEPGVALRNELARRLGKHRCKWIDFGDCKDANEFLIKHGPVPLKETITKNVREFPIDGIITIKDFEEAIDHAFKHGFPAGATVGEPGFDEHLRFVGSQWTLIVGATSSGKSEVVDQVTESLAFRHDWPCGMFSAENLPYVVHFKKLAEKFLSKRFESLSAKELSRAKEWINHYYAWVNVKEKDLSVDAILERFGNLVARRGMKQFVIDPWNQLSHRYGGDKLDYINKSLTKITNFCHDTDSHLFLVVHPVKPQKTKDGGVITPRLSDAAGSMDFGNQAWNGIVVHRNFDENYTEIHVDKVKFNFLGKFGSFRLNWDGPMGGSYWRLHKDQPENQQVTLPYKDNDETPF